MSNDKTPYDADLYEAYAEYIEMYEESRAEYKADKEQYKQDKKDYKKGLLAEKPQKPYKYDRSYYPDEEDYFGTRMAEFIKFLPTKEGEAIDAVLDKIEKGENLDKKDKAALNSYIQNMKNIQKDVGNYQTKVLDELNAWATSGVDVDEESIAKVRKIRRSEKKLYEDAKKYIAEHKEEHLAYTAEQQKNAQDEKSAENVLPQTNTAVADTEKVPETEQKNIHAFSKIEPLYVEKQSQSANEGKNFINKSQYNNAEIQTIVNDTNGDYMQVTIIDGKKHGAEIHRDKDGKIVDYKLYDHGQEIKGDHQINIEDYVRSDGAKATRITLDGKPFGTEIVTDADGNAKVAFYERGGYLIGSMPHSGIEQTILHSTMNKEEMVQTMQNDQQKQRKRVQNLGNNLQPASRTDNEQKKFSASVRQSGQHTTSQPAISTIVQFKRGRNGGYPR